MPGRHSPSRRVRLERPGIGLVPRPRGSRTSGPGRCPGRDRRRPGRPPRAAQGPGIELGIVAGPASRDRRDSPIRARGPSVPSSRAEAPALRRPRSGPGEPVQASSRRPRRLRKSREDAAIQIATWKLTLTRSRPTGTRLRLVPIQEHGAGRRGRPGGQPGSSRRSRDFTNRRMRSGHISNGRVRPQAGIGRPIRHEWESEGCSARRAETLTRPTPRARGGSLPTGRHSASGLPIVTRQRLALLFPIPQSPGGPRRSRPIAISANSMRESCHVAQPSRHANPSLLRRIAV